MKTLLLRIGGVFGSSAIAALAGGALLDIELWRAACLAGAMSTASVIERLLRNWAVDGVLSKDEIAAAFNKKEG